jgi:phosphoribosylformylglycinamidine synthase
LFNESQSRIVITVPANNVSAALFLLEEHGAPVRRIGHVGGDALEISADGTAFVWPVAQLRDAWWNSISRVMAE